MYHIYGISYNDDDVMSQSDNKGKEEKFSERYLFNYYLYTVNLFNWLY